MNSEDLKLSDLRTIREGMLYMLPENLPGICLEDHVRTVQTYQVNKPTGEKIADHTIRLAKATIMMIQEPESVAIGNLDPYDLDLISKMRDFEPEVVQALASDQPWVRKHLRDQYVGALFSQGYLAGETYLGLDIEEPLDYDQSALLMVLPIAYEVARNVGVEDFSTLELSREAFMFCDEETIMMHPEYETFLEERKVGKKDKVVPEKVPPRRRPKTEVLAELQERGWEVKDGGKP